MMRKIKGINTTGPIRITKTRTETDDRGINETAGSVPLRHPPCAEKERYLKWEWEYVLYVAYVEKCVKIKSKLVIFYHTNLQVQK